MNDEITQVIEEKFTRCPECRSFSVRIITDLSFKEKIKSYFVPVTVQVCGNCSHRFVSVGSLRNSFKQLFHSLTRTFPKKLIITVLPLILIAGIIIFFIVGGSNKNDESPPPETQPVQTIETAPDTEEKLTHQITPSTTNEQPTQNQAEELTDESLADNTETQNSQVETSHPKEDVQQPQEKNIQPPVETPETTPVQTFSGEIVLNRNRFGVNWRPLGEGVQITRISNGPVKDAGLKVGDIILEVDNTTVKGEGSGLELARDEVFYGKRKEAIIKVRRNNEILLFKMIRSNIP